MKFVKFFSVLFILLFSLVAFAQPNQPFVLENVLDNSFDSSGNLTFKATAGITKANSELSAVPDFIRGIFLNEVLDIYLTMDSGKTERICMDALNARINSVSRKPCLTPTLKVFVSEQTLTEIVSDKDIFTALIQAQSEGNIRTEGIGFGPTLKVTFVNISSMVFNFIGSIFAFFS